MRARPLEGRRAGPPPPDGRELGDGREPLDEEARQDETLCETMTHLLEECRMVLPGIQALFGFQLIVVFRPDFADLEPYERMLHLVASGASAVAIASIMAPAAYHRQAEQRSVSEGLIRLSTRLLLFALFPLAFAFTADFYLISRVITESKALAGAIAALVGTVFVFLWYLLPRARRLQALLRR